MSQFTLALNTSTIRPASLMDKIRIAGETGYDAIELWTTISPLMKSKTAH